MIPLLAAEEVVRERLELARVPEGGILLAALVALALSLVLIVWLYRREGEAPVWRKILLAGLRVLLLLGVAAILLDPVRTVERVRELEAVTVVLVDESASMSVSDRYPVDLAGPIRRWTGLSETDLEVSSREEIARRLLESGTPPLLARLAAKNPVRVVGFAGDVRPIQEIPRGGRPVPVATAADGTATDLARALRAARDGGEGRPVAGVVLLTDGRSNEGEDPVAAAEALARRDIPLHVVGLGDPAEPRNTEVLDVTAPKRVLAREPFRFEVRLRGTGVPREETDLFVERRAPGSDSGPRVGHWRVRFPADGRELTVEVTDRIEKPRKVVYVARMTPLDRETTKDDNEAETPVEIVDEKVRVLLVAGGPNREYRALRALLTRDKTVDLSCWLQSADADFPQDGNKRLKRFPDTRSALFEYDLVLLLDIEPLGGGREWVERLKELVRDQGGGVAFVAGRTATLDYLRSPEGEALGGLLPVQPDLVRADRALAVGLPPSNSWSLELTREGEGHVVTRLADSPEGARSLWSSLPGFYGPFPVDREKPGAEVLVRWTDPRSVGRYGSPVVLAAQWYGAGRTLFLSTGETWRWIGRAEETFDRFWLGVVRFLTAGRLTAGSGRLHLETDRDEFAIGERIEVRARVLGAGFEPTADAEADLVVVGPDSEERDARLAADPTRPGWYRGFVSATSAGWMELSLPGRGEGDRGPRLRLRIARPDRELAAVRLDRPRLRDLAARTGGRFLDPGAIDEVVDLIGDRRERLVIPASSRPIWDRWWTLLLLAALVTVEWIIRKWSGMA